MKTAVDCLPCYLNQVIRVARFQGCSEEIEKKLVLAVSSHLPKMDMSKSPPENSMEVYRLISEITGNEDPYLEIKRQENSAALARLPQLKERIGKASNPLKEAVYYAIAGNLIDYGAPTDLDADALFANRQQRELAIDHREVFLNRVNELGAGAKVLYLADNCGEIVYDSLVIELLYDAGLQIVVAVKERAIINDALKEDAQAAGLDQFARIISNGIVCPGTVLDMCSLEFKKEFETADIVISKGQGNFETLSENEKDIFFFLTIKCAVVGHHMKKLAQYKGELPGQGEMVVFYSGS